MVFLKPLTIKSIEFSHRNAIAFNSALDFFSQNGKVEIANTEQHLRCFRKGLVESLPKI